MLIILLIFLTKQCGVPNDLTDVRSKNVTNQPTRCPERPFMCLDWEYYIGSQHIYMCYIIHYYFDFYFHDFTPSRCILHNYKNNTSLRSVDELFPSMGTSLGKWPIDADSWWGVEAPLDYSQGWCLSWREAPSWKNLIKTPAAREREAYGNPYGSGRGPLLVVVRKWWDFDGEVFPNIF